MSNTNWVSGRHGEKTDTITSTVIMPQSLEEDGTAFLSRRNDLQ